jgi:hypothetical protein
MPITYARDPSGLEGRGTVWLSADEDGGWFGYWDLEPDGPPEPLEQGPGWQSAQDAVAWGRSRAIAGIHPPRVEVVTDGRGTIPRPKI